jgi:predicted sulfurtransferase
VPNVFQLDGGILKYFEEVGGAHWNGECFVFDRRVALDPELNPTENHYEITAKPSRMEQYYRWKAKQEADLQNLERVQKLPDNK